MKYVIYTGNVDELGPDGEIASLFCREEDKELTIAMLRTYAEVKGICLYIEIAEASMNEATDDSPFVDKSDYCSSFLRIGWNVTCFLIKLLCTFHIYYLRLQE